MKKLLGSLLLLGMSLFAKSAYEWEVKLGSHELYLHQATLLSMRCSFAKEGKNDDVEFTPPADSAFEFILLNESRHFDGDLQTLSYQYLLFAKKAGEHRFTLKPQMLFTTQSAIDNVIIGRDNVNDLAVEKEIAQIPEIKVDVKETVSALTGRFGIRAELDLDKVSAYEPAHLMIRIEGEGNFQALEKIDFKIEGVKVFTDEVEPEYEPGESGYKGSWTQRFAFVGEKTFVIPSVEIAYFDLETKSQKQLKTQAFKIAVKEDGITREELIDAVELPSDGFDPLAYAGYLYYLLSFIAGFVVAKLIRLPKTSVKLERGGKIKESKSPKELLSALIQCDRELFEEEIDLLESSVYKGNSVNLSEIKKRALARL